MSGKVLVTPFFLQVPFLIKKKKVFINQTKCVTVWWDQSKNLNFSSFLKICLMQKKKTLNRPKNTIATVGHGGGSIMLLGCFSFASLFLPRALIKIHGLAPNTKLFLHKTCRPLLGSEVVKMWPSSMIMSQSTNSCKKKKRMASEDDQSFGKTKV